MRRIPSPASLLRALRRDRRAATAVEYGFLISLIVLAMFVALQNFAGTAIRIWNSVAQVVTSHNPQV